MSPAQTGVPGAGRLIVGRHIDLTIVINHSKADPIQPSGPSQKVLIDPVVGEEIDHRLERETEYFDFNEMTECVHPSDRSPKRPRLASFDLQIEQLPVLALKKAVARSGVEIGQQIDHFASALQNHW